MSGPARGRLDLEMVARGLVESRHKAQALVLAGEVTVDGLPAAKPGMPVTASARIEIRERPPYVSRGGLKLRHALSHFGVSVSGRVCLDVGASTGGFTDCLLQHGAARVIALDTGSGQLDWKLRSDPRVELRENCNARYATVELLGARVSLAVADVSFISVTLLLPAIVNLLEPPGEMVILVKPQFEVAKGQVGKGGIVKDPALHEAACARVADAAAALGFATSLTESPIFGAEGNKEFLLHARR